MKKYVCTICGYVHEGDSAPDACPICKAKADKFKEQAGEKTWAAEHVVGVAKGVDERIIEGLREKIDGFLPEFYEYQPIAKRVAQEFGAVFVPLQEHFDKAGKRYGKKRFSTDGVHPWSAGVELVARAWLDAVEVIE